MLKIKLYKWYICNRRQINSNDSRLISTDTTDTEVVVVHSKLGDPGCNEGFPIIKTRR